MLEQPVTEQRTPMWRTFAFGGLIGALLGFAAALTPSLLPRPPLFVGLLAGLGAALGYGAGVAITALLRWAFGRHISDRMRSISWRVLAIAGPLLAIAALAWGAREQDEVRRLVGEPSEPASLFIIALIAVPFAWVLVMFGRGVRGIIRGVNRLFGRFLPARVAALAGILVVVVLGWWLVSGVLFQGLISLADSTYSASNEGTEPGVNPTTSSLRSGGPGSLVSWESLGKKGRTFVAGGPTAAQLREFPGAAASGVPTEPIRIYVGLDSAPTAEERAALAVEELERTDAFDRSVLVVASVTGTGWLEPQSLDAIEYLWGGNTAIAAIQYSFLPSWISFLVDQARATDAGRELFEAVYEAVHDRPEGQRPKLISYGLSLGSFAAQAPFGSAQDITTRTDGALFMGTPGFTEPWLTISADRDDGSPQWQPAYQDGESVRFGGQAVDLESPSGTWQHPRVVYLQHANDPVVWWDWGLAVRKPDWLSEPRGRDVSSATRWYPFLTFLQVTVDQFFGTSVPDGQGHNYPPTIVGTWQYVLPAPGWSDADLDHLQDRIDAYGGD